jgi:hypothetical protein
LKGLGFVRFERLYTYFLFPFALDCEAVRADHPKAWPGDTKWIEGLDPWIERPGQAHSSPAMNRLKPWKRATYTQFDSCSPAYTDLLFFTSIVRHVFFDTNIRRSSADEENQLRCYTISLDPSARLWFEGADALGRKGRAEVQDLRLFLSAEGVGILSIGVVHDGSDARHALWINRRLRKLYPVDAGSLRNGRAPNWLALRLEERGKQLETLCEEKFENPHMVGFYPPLPNTIKSLLYFADYGLEEYEPVLDENMFVYSFAELDASEVPAGPACPDLDMVEEFLFLRHSHGGAIRYNSPSGTTLIGITTHNCSVLHVKHSSPCKIGWLIRLCASGLPIERDELDTWDAFQSHFYLMMVIACFYRAVLMDFGERSALVARRLLNDQKTGKLTSASIEMVNRFRIEFLHFSGYWHFDDISNKKADNDFFRRICSEYRVNEMKSVLTSELRHMTEFVYNFYQLRTTEAVNRLALLSLIFGGGAVLTGFFGMNFGREFTRVLFEGERNSWLHYLLVVIVTTFVFGSLLLGTIVVLRSWREYFAILNPPRSRGLATSIKRER